MFDSAALAHYWSGDLLHTNLFIALNLVGALLLGMAVGYERSYHGRAAGMRTYGLVCMSAAALTIFVGYTRHWFGGQLSPQAPLPLMLPDPTRVVQGIVTGIGFLCGGVIVKEGMNIRGLTTAASIWGASAIGVLVGVGFYLAAISMASLCVLVMTGLRWVEGALPKRIFLRVTLTFRQDFIPRQDVLEQVARERGYVLLAESLAVKNTDNNLRWSFSVEALPNTKSRSIAELSNELRVFDGVSDFEIENYRW